MITRTWRIAALATLGMLCTALSAPSGAASEWTFLGAADPDVTSLAVSPVDPDFMLARVDIGSVLPVARTVWQSVDGGTNWRPLLDAGVWSGGQLAFTSDGRGLVADDGGLQVSEFGGQWWQPWAPGDAPPVVFGDLAVGAGDAIFASAAETGGPYHTWGVYQLDLEGAQMHPRNPPLPSDHTTIKLLAADPVQAGVLVVLSDTWENPWPQDSRLWVSTDGGMSWTERTYTLPSRDLAALHFTDSGWLATFASDHMGGSAGVYRSLDQGQSWVSIGHYLPDQATDAAQDPADPQRLLVTGWNGVHLSEDGGQSWHPAMAGTAGQMYSSVQFAPDGGAFVTGFMGGLFRADASLQVLERMGPQLGAMATTSVAINPADPVDAAGLGFFSIPTLTTSSDGGLSWTRDQSVVLRQANQVAYGPDGRLYVAGRDSDASLMVRQADGSWSGLMPDVGSLSDLHSLAFGASAQHMVVSASIRVGTGSENQIRHTSDGGATWTVAHVSSAPSRYRSQVLNASGPVGGRFLALLADTVLSDPVLLLGTDGGQSWSPAGTGLPTGLREAQVCTTGTNAPRAYLSALENNQQRLFRSDDDGLTWQRTGWLPTGSSIHIGQVMALWCDPARADVVVMGGRHGTVLRSTDAGDTFALLGDDLGERTHHVNAFAASPAGLLYAATNEGAWALELPDDAPLAPADLVVISSGARMRPTLTLSWVGGQPQVMVRRNGALLAVVDNTGHFEDRPHQRDLPASYQVCNGDGSHCTESGSATH